MLFSSLQKSILIGVFLITSSRLNAQSADSISRNLYFGGAVSITNNGFSFIPSFSLGKPATIVNLSLHTGKRFSFEPEFRYSLEGKPWSFIFIWRYKLLKINRFQVTLGTHLPALSFRTAAVVKNGQPQDVIESLRFFPVAEVSPNYQLGKNISLGIFYLYGRGVDPGISTHTHFLSLRGGFSNIPLSGRWYFKFNPQFYYLKSDALDGFYTAVMITLGKRSFPLTISSLINKSLNSTIPGKKFDWNVSLSYNFSSKYTKNKR